MKKIIALALALIMALSMASVAFAAEFAGNDDADGKALSILAGAGNWNANAGTLKVAPGTTLKLNFEGLNLKGYKVSTDFTKGELCGASYIESVKINKDKTFVLVTIKESTKLFEEPVAVKGLINLTAPNSKVVTNTWGLDFVINNNVEDAIGGAKKLVDADLIVGGENTVVKMDEDGGLVYFAEGQLKGYVKMAADEEAFFALDTALTGDAKEAFEEALGEDFDGIVELFAFTGNGFKNDVDFYYNAYAEDPHYFYAWDGEAFTAIDAKYDADEDVDDYVFTAPAKGTIVVTDVELVAAAEEETKNPDTGANDVVGVAAALAVVSLVAAGAVSLKK